MALIDLDNFVASFITAMKEYNPRIMSIPACIKEALYKQGLTYHDGQIVKNQIRISAEAKETGYSESEDEKIRKEIRQLIQGMHDADPRKERWLAWLEKQDNESVNIDIESMVSSYEQRLLSQSNGVRNSPLVNMCLTAFRRGIENTLEELNLKKLEKQGGQKLQGKTALETINEEKIDNANYVKSADKVKPKIENTRPLLSDFFNAEYERGKADALQSIEWSEEDEEYLRRAINATKDVYPMTTKWLKSLKQRYTWKPSEEQMKALHDMNLTGNISYAGQGQTLFELYNDLKKL